MPVLSAKNIRYTILSFIRDSRSVGVLLLLCTAFSLLITNAGTGTSYHEFWETHIPFLQELYLPHSVLHFINDVLMALFFLLAGMEIKREFLTGELSSVKQAVLPVTAACGGVILPAVIFLLFNRGTPFQNGWAIPTATDIAFSLGIVSLLGKRVPDSLRIFLTALAIIDDLIAIVIIAVFYGGEINLLYLAAAMLVILLLYFINKQSWKHAGIIRLLLGTGLWFCMYRSGIHATVAGVVFAALLPENLLHTYEKKLHTFVNFIVIPLFVLANTSILLPKQISDAFASSLSWGIMAGLLLGKPLGIMGASLLMIRAEMAALPQNTSFHQFWGIGILAGIGFTMSIFVTSLAYDEEATISVAKIAVMSASFLSMIAGFIWLSLAAGRKSGKLSEHS